MTLFWLIGAALAAGVLVLVLRPLFSRKATSLVSRREANIAIYRDQLRELDADLRAGTLAEPDYERSRRELEMRLLEDARLSEGKAARRASRAAAWAVLAAIPLGAAALYFAVGNPAALVPQADEHAISAQQLETLISRLAARLRENPDDADGWRLLGRSYTALGRFPEAADAYAKAALREPRDAELLADFADALAMARGQAGAGNLQGEPEKLALRALEIDPQNLKALALAGTAAFDRRDFAAAAAYWERMLPLVPADSEDARSIRSSIAEARSLQGKPEAARMLKGTVRLSPRLEAKAQPDDTVFIFARAAEGPPMPLALKRAKVSELPVSFALDDSMAMAPGMNLSAHPRVVVVARVSRAGTAAPRAGDLQGTSAPVAHDAQGVSIVIDTVVR